MKKLLTFLSISALFMIFAVPSVSREDIDNYYDDGCSIPIFMKREDLEKSVQWKSGRAIQRPGKIYYKDNYIYVNELYKGIHIINNHNPASPVMEGYISAPGCVDMAIKNNILYVDNSVDLVAFDLTSKQETHREINVLPEPPAPDCQYGSIHNRQKDMIVVGWEKRN